jgi:hypothetical protein
MFIKDLQALAKLDPFTDGNDRQRAHLNALIDRINAMIDAANREPVGADSTITIWCNFNAGPTLVTFKAYVGQIV